MQKNLFIGYIIFLNFVIYISKAVKLTRCLIKDLT